MQHQQFQLQSLPLFVDQGGGNIVTSRSCEHQRVGFHVAVASSMRPHRALQRLSHRSLCGLGGWTFELSPSPWLALQTLMLQYTYL